MSLLHQYLVYMKPSNMLEKMRKGEQQNVSEEHTEERINTELEPEVCSQQDFFFNLSSLQLLEFWK